MKKINLKNNMIIENGLGELFFLIGNGREWVIARDANNINNGNYGFSSTEFNDDLTHIKDPVLSIIKVYDSIQIQAPFILDISKLFEIHKPNLLWERKLSPISKSKLESFKNKKDAMAYIRSIVPPYIVVD